MSGGGIEMVENPHGGIEMAENPGAKLPPITKKRKKRAKKPKPAETEIEILDGNTNQNARVHETVEEQDSQSPIEPQVSPKSSDETLQSDANPLPDNSIIGVCVHRTDHLSFSVRQLVVKGLGFVKNNKALTNSLIKQTTS